MINFNGMKLTFSPSCSRAVLKKVARLLCITSKWRHLLLFVSKWHTQTSRRLSTELTQLLFHYTGKSVNANHLWNLKSEYEISASTDRFVARNLHLLGVWRSGLDLGYTSWLIREHDSQFHLARLCVTFNQEKEKRTKAEQKNGNAGWNTIRVLSTY